MHLPYTIFPLGDSALTVDFGNRIDEALNERVLQLYHRLQNISPSIRDLVPAYSSLTIHYDVMAFHSEEAPAFEVVKKLIEPLILQKGNYSTGQSRQVRIPVCYADSFGPDLKDIAAEKNLPVEEIIQLHVSKSYRVYMIGFLPGFAYMGKVDERIVMPRRQQPRTNIPAGAVGIAGEQTGIYPFNSPGGWNIVGQTPVTLFDASREEPVLLQPGDIISFYSITEDEFKNYQSRHS